MALDLTTLVEILAVLVALGVGADVIMNYLLKSQMTTAVNSINATATAAINANLAVTQAGISSLLDMATLGDVNHLANTKAVVHAVQAQSQPQSQGKTT
ncbi:MAG: hypothetical protein QXP97_08165 [Desulfurococcus sp.]|uniref:hypothetical protein n=1 Tax=Thermoprotei TaxID=183924 RepID=UPI0031606B40